MTANGYRGVNPENYSVTANRITTTVLTQSEQEWRTLQDTAANFGAAVVVPLPAETPEQQRTAAKAYYEAQRAQVADREGFRTIDEQVVYAAVGRALSNGGHIGRLTLTSPDNRVTRVADKFGEALVANSRRQHTNGAQQRRS